MKIARIGYGILLLATLLLALVNSAYHIFLLLAAELLLPVFLFLYSRYSRYCLRVRLLGERKSCDRGEKVPLCIELSNSGIFPLLNVQIAVSYRILFLPGGEEMTMVASVPGGKIRQVEFFLTSEHCGQLEIAVDRVTILDPFSLFRTSMEPDDQQDKRIFIHVLPLFYEETILPDCALQKTEVPDEVYSSQKSGNDPSEVFGLREYLAGDRPRQIHWKLSLKQDCLMVREFSLPIFDRLLIFIDFNVDSLAADVLSLTDTMLETALSLSYHLQSNSVRHSIAWFDARHQTTDSISIAAEEDIYRAVQHLFSLPLYEGAALGKQLQQAGHPERSLENILYFEPNALPYALHGERSAVS